MGQNFLTSKKIVEEIVVAADIKPDDIILEIGPGKGILTEALLEKARRVIAVEKDKKLADFLKEKFSNRKNLEIIHADILKFNPKDYNLKTENYKIVANIPYYITSHFLREFLESDFQPSLMVLMVQKEVAERITEPFTKGRKANPLSSKTDIEGNFSRKRFAFLPKESILSISVKAFGEPKIIRIVPAEYFSPKPKVDSAVLVIDNISKIFFSGDNNLKIDEKDFFKLVKIGFSSKRKMLKNNLAKMLDSRCSTFFGKCGINEKVRAQDLSLSDWKCLFLQKIV